MTEQAVAFEDKTQSHLEAVGVTWKTKLLWIPRGTREGVGPPAYLGWKHVSLGFYCSGAGRSGSLEELRYSGQTSRWLSRVLNLSIGDSRSQGHTVVLIARLPASPCSD